MSSQPVFIRVTPDNNPSGTVERVNIAHITNYRAVVMGLKRVTRICLVGEENWICVVESPETIDEKIDNALALAAMRGAS